ncbi:TonB-dependent receptor [Pedobacter sp. BS3]|nr:TonB-dependent receptor [Pedobacter sp. BS3]
MKLTGIMLLTLTLHVSATSFAQRVTISKQNSSLKEVFKDLHQQTGYYFIYNNEVIKNARPVTVNLVNENFDEALRTIFKDQNLVYTLRNNTLVIRVKKEKTADGIQLPPVNVKGKVTDSKGEPLPGATIRIKGDIKVAIADANGNFSLPDVDNNAVLVISYTGFVSQEIPVKGQTGPLSITLKEDTQGLSEVVVVGYGTQKRINLTGAVAQIDSKDLESRPSPNITTSLQGLLPGLNIQSNNGNPSDAPDINVRGFNSINGGSPLILIDGIQGSIDRVNPLDVESVTVLKDAASSAIYGARGAFGVILITTKKGKAGKMTVDYTNSFGQTTTTTRTDYISDPYVYGKTVDAALFGYNGTTYTGYNDADWEKIKQVASGELAPFNEQQPDGSYKFFGNTNWYSYLFRKWQPMQNHNISLSGGNEKVQAYLSGRYYRSATIQNIVDPHLTKYNLKGNVNFKANSWLEIADNIQFSTDNHIDYGGARNGYGGIWSTTTWYYLFPFLPKELNGMPFDYYNSGAQGALEKGSNYQRFYSEQFINTLSGKVTPFKGMVLNLDYSNTINHIANSVRLNKYDVLTGAKATPTVGGVNKLTEDRDRNYYNALNIYGTYSRDIAKDHHFKLLLGYNQEHYQSDDITAAQGDLLIEDLANLNLGTNLLQADGSASVWAVQGYFGRFNYDFRNKYLLEINARYDGSSRFPSESRWGLFPSISGGWYISRENFWKPLEKVASSLKLRASYGKLGNQNVDLYTFTQIMGLGQTNWLYNNAKLNYVGIPAPLPSVVSWESSKTVDFGADLGFLKDKLTVSFDWYEKNISGMYLPGEPLPAVFGASEPKENIASLRNRGFELGVTYNDQFMVAGAPLHFRAYASVYNFNGVITKYPNPNGLMSSFWEGQKLGEIYGYHIAGQFQSDEEALAYQNSFNNPSTSLGQVYKFELNTATNADWKKLRAGDIKYVDVNGDGAINKGDNTLANHGDLQSIGNAMPRFPFGFSFGADWKAFDISIAGTGVAHQDWYPTGDIFWGTYERPYLSFIRKDLISNAWTPEHPEKTYPQIYRGYVSLGAQRSLGEVNDYYLTNVGYLRVKNLTVGYTLPQKLTQKVNIQKLRIYFSGENILTWRFGNLTKYIDPEQAGSGISYSDPNKATSIDRVENYPMGKTFSLGVNLTL